MFIDEDYDYLTNGPHAVKQLEKIYSEQCLLVAICFSENYYDSEFCEYEFRAAHAALSGQTFNITYLKFDDSTIPEDFLSKSSPPALYFDVRESDKDVLDFLLERLETARSSPPPTVRRRKVPEITLGNWRNRIDRKAQWGHLILVVLEALEEDSLLCVLLSSVENEGVSYFDERIRDSLAQELELEDPCNVSHESPYNHLSALEINWPPSWVSDLHQVFFESWMKGLGGSVEKNGLATFTDLEKAFKNRFAEDPPVIIYAWHEVSGMNCHVINHTERYFEWCNDYIFPLARNVGALLILTVPFKVEEGWAAHKERILDAPSNITIEELLEFKSLRAADIKSLLPYILPWLPQDEYSRLARKVLGSKKEIQYEDALGKIDVVLKAHQKYSD